MTPEQRRDRADRMKRFLEGEDWTAAWQSVRSLYIHIIESTDDEAEATRARQMLRAATKAREHLETVISDGQVAQAELAARRSLLRM